MATEVKVPELPESVSEATVGEWQKNKGDKVGRDENLVDLETDKVVLEVPSTSAGVLAEIKVSAGDTVKAGDVLAIVEEGDGAGAGDDGGDGDADDDQKAADSADEKDASEDKDQSSDDDQSEKSDDGDDEAVASPAAKKLMDENDVAARNVEGTGKDGRITKADVQKAIDAKSSSKADKSEEKSSPRGDSEREEQAVSEQADRQALADAPNERTEQRVPMTRIRQRIAERLLDASQNTAMLTTFNEVDMQAVMALRNQYKDKFEKDHEVRLGFMSFFVKAAVEALKRFPIVNASIDEGDIVYHGFYDIGVAVSSPRGLLVPVLRDADQQSYAQIESTIRDLGKRAQEGKVTMDEMSGGTFTITNGGVFGSLLSTPIINPPQAAILGMHATNEKPVVVDGEIVIRPVMQLALSYDHRLIDGRDAVLFLRTIKELIEDPARLLLQV
ncbi:Dihydrolipoamide succinyltransferase component of 2-oxoglutarate dehydrogenase complex protein [Salinisphaera shabanensis E1L3A]|jgi:2-oxoglutarate dehydrogenase E2 component (dihydrolipoamide succinyltransferase)|uniref:Dihydrolipoyllysine-residue succinyltransferase component of 2-oxoglutarate dehydrogenase complex n=1 Tax=Salinisphaera shabanensis E1L3A TaxID=1033802 RepID=F7QCI8_9GAMM|nr:2-oxoglutarate dehydrogenase complex dihydrolipoyllysine-residue succinyltransferase [Salinisphaera shabanensis]ERJ18504.1 Dihydrolipoamide succinyltransferase component of 2-oxoglutarate dehydrogenase complex protein [Salinisphaera shabanensis E1L3A]